MTKIETPVIEASKDLGANWINVFFKILLPLSVPGIVSGITMVFVPCVSTFVISKMFEGDFWKKASNVFIKGNITYSTLFAILIVFFCYFYSSVVFNTEEVADNLKKNNCFIPGIRPGTFTKNYLEYVVNRITFIGALYLCLVCLLPEILVTRYSMPISIGGTGLLIVIDVVIELIGQIQSYIFSNKYSAINKQRRVRVK